LHHKDPRLQSQQQVQEQTGTRTSATWPSTGVKENRFIRLADDSVRSVSVAPEGKFAPRLRRSARYELMSNLDGRRYQDVYVINMQTGERKLA